PSPGRPSPCLCRQLLAPPSSSFDSCSVDAARVDRGAQGGNATRASPMPAPTPGGTSVISMTPPSPDALRALGLPAQVRACLFDPDGVLTQTATLHFAAWKHTFDELLADLGESEFTSADYAAHVDGRRRYDGVRTFLASRGIEREEGSPDDPPEADTICG